MRNVQATHDANGHAEPSLAVDPRNPQVILGASQFLTPAGARLPGTFFSANAGQSWHDNGPLPLPQGFSQGVDTTTAFLQDGVGYVCAFALRRGSSSFASRNRSSAVLLWKTSNDGRSFSHPITVYDGRGFQDHPWLATGGKDTLYVAWANRAGLVFTRSTNGGATFATPRVLVAGSKPANPVLIVAHRSIDIFYEESRLSQLTVGLVALSPSGTLIQRTPVIASGSTGTPSPGQKGQAFFPLFAAAATPEGDLLAVAIPTVDPHAGHPTIKLWRSTNHGRTWQGPTTVAHGGAANQTQLQPQLGIDGHRLVVSFFSVTRTSVYTEWLAETGREAPSFGLSRLISTTRFHASGWLGDYQALTTHGSTSILGWNDGRTGRLQILTATIANNSPS